MIDETLQLLGETVARRRKRINEIEEALHFAIQAALLFLDVHRLIDSDFQIMEDASRMWAYASCRVRHILAGGNEIQDEDVIGQAEIILHLNEVVMKDNAERLEKNSEETRALHEALIQLQEAVANARSTAKSKEDDSSKRTEDCGPTQDGALAEVDTACLLRQ